MRKALVTGGAGFIGSHLVHALVARGTPVRVFDNLSSGNRANLAAVAEQIEFVQGDITDPAAVLLAAEGVEAIFHHAALASVPRSVEAPLESHAACATGTLHVLDAARRQGVRRVVYAASSSCYGDLPGDVKSETDPLAPLSPYAAAKLAGEMYCQAFHATYGLETVRLRYFNVFGPRQDPNSPYSAVIPIFLARMLRGERPKIFGDGLQTRDFVHVSDVVRANLLAAEVPAAAGQVFNIGAAGTTSLLDLVREFNAILGTTLEPQHEPPRPGDVRTSRADITQAQTILGFRPAVTLAAGLRDLVEQTAPAAGRAV